MRHGALRILLADDNDDHAVLLREALRDRRRLELVHVARDGQQAVDYLQLCVAPGGPPTPSLVLMDLNMPRKNGLEALADLKGDPRTASVPVVMMTVSQRDEDVDLSYRAGACSYLNKPLSFEGLVDLMKNFEEYWAEVAVTPHRW